MASNHGGGFDGSGGFGGGDIWAPFRRKDGRVPRPVEWIRDWAHGSLGGFFRESVLGGGVAPGGCGPLAG